MHVYLYAYMYIHDIYLYSAYTSDAFISILQWDAVCCSVLQCVAVCCSVLQCVAVSCSELQCVAVCCSACSVLPCVAVCCSVLQCIAACCSMFQFDRRCSHDFPRHVKMTHVIVCVYSIVGAHDSSQPPPFVTWHDSFIYDSFIYDSFICDMTYS